MDMLHIKDVRTKQVFKLRPSEHTATVVTRDGVRVKLHPTSIKLFVKQGDRFEGQSVYGGREMVRL